MIAPVVEDLVSFASQRDAERKEQGLLLLNCNEWLSIGEEKVRFGSEDEGKRTKIWIRKMKGIKSSNDRDSSPPLLSLHLPTRAALAKTTYGMAILSP